MLEKVEIVNNGNTTTVDLISEFEIKINDQIRRIVLLTANEIDQNGLIKILATEISDGKFVRISSDDDWTVVKNVMRSIISSSKGDFTYTNTSDSMHFEASDDYARVIAVQDSAKQALVKDYEDNKPEVEKTEVSTSEEVVDSNSAIYPTESESTPIGSEVVPGISETPVVSEASAVVEESTSPANEESSAKVEPVQEEVVAAPVQVQEDSSAQEVVATPTAETAPENSSEEQAIAVEDAPVVNEEVSKVNEETVSEPVKVENSTPVSNEGDADARTELINDIIAAVDKYIAKNGNSNASIKDQIAKMQEELNKMQETIN
ncbi:MAG: hypothetical protein IJ572_05620 [Bacilli bacterium]|nr:hypothetical protein [Bacilli bacterium]